MTPDTWRTGAFELIDGTGIGLESVLEFLIAVGLMGFAVALAFRARRTRRRARASETAAAPGPPPAAPAPAAQDATPAAAQAAGTTAAGDEPPPDDEPADPDYQGPGDWDGGPLDPDPGATPDTLDPQAEPAEPQADSR